METIKIFLYQNNNIFNSYDKYRSQEMKSFMKNITLINNIRAIFGSSIKNDDWIKLLNIGNIMYLSALNYEDLDLDSDPKYELLRDAILEKVVMLTVAYFCIATELRLLSPNKNNKNINGEFYHFKAVEFSSLFLPVSCPIVKHYIFSYYKHYGQDMDIIPEGKIIDMKINLLRSEIEQDKDTLSFLRIKNINYIKNNNNDFNEEKRKNNTNTNSGLNINGKINNNYINNLNKQNIINNENININNNNNSNVKKNNNIIIKPGFSLNLTKTKNTNNNIHINNNKKNTNNMINNNNNINIKNGNFGFLPNNNFINVAVKSKINIENAPKFKLNFENLINNNIDNDIYEEQEYDEEEDDKKELINKIMLKNRIKQNNNINKKQKINNQKINNNINGGSKTHRPLNKKIGLNQINKNINFIMNNNNTNNKILTKIVNNNIKNKSKNNNCMSSRDIYDKISLMNELKMKGNLTERIYNNNNQNIMNNKYILNKNKIPKTQRELIQKNNKISNKDIASKKSLNNNTNYGYVKQRIKKENIIYNKNKNVNNKKNVGNNIIINNNNNNQRPNSSKAFVGKNNNFIFSGNNKYIELHNRNDNINMNNQGYSKQNNRINSNQGKNIGLLKSYKIF